MKDTFLKFRETKLSSYLHGDAELFSNLVCETRPADFQRRYATPMFGHVSHEELVESVEPAGDASRQTNQPYQKFLITPEVANVRKQLVKSCE